MKHVLNKAVTHHSNGRDTCFATLNLGCVTHQL